LLGTATLLYAVFFCYAYYRLEKLRPLSMEWIERRKKPPFEPCLAGTFCKKDILPLSVVTAVYAAAAIINLGSTVSPQSFHRFEHGDEAVVIELAEPARVAEIFYFTGLYHGRDNTAYHLELSSDGAVWAEQYRETTGMGPATRHSGMTQEHSQTFRWMSASLLPDRADDTRFIRIRQIYAPLELGEISIRVQDPQTGNIRTLTAEDFIVPEGAERLFDEQRVVPERYDILNSTHFDEIYHPYTAYQHLRGIYPYETTHPPLGKLITSAGIAIFGMTPFGWRFMPALFGILMLPLLYILLKWMFGKTSVAVCGTLLFAFEFMHFVQTRISTIDVYTVFFILCMSLFMFRYFTTALDAPFWRANTPLIFAGLSFGLGAAVKWQSIYAGAGMLFLFCIHLSRRARHCRREERSFLPHFFGTGAVALFSFIIIPGVIYIACYIPYALPRAPEGGFDGVMAFVRAVWGEGFRNQEHMYKYHSALTATHPYSARWYEWIINWKPILYYWNGIREAGTRGTLWAMTHPLITWAGLGALAACVRGLIKLKSHTALFVLVFYFTNLAPWIFVSRIAFPYHYFPSAYVFHRMIERDAKRGTRHMVAFTAAAVALFILFYPVLSGTQVPEWYPQYLLQWLPNGNWWL
jgi:predicted membrane-bound dolichyl-phosphate-mannose-protein mannosyltransferase